MNRKTEFRLKNNQFLKALQHLKIGSKVTLKNHEEEKISVLMGFYHLKIVLHQENLKEVLELSQNVLQ
jgi:hypothetical protein